MKMPTDSWIERVRAADAEAERATLMAGEFWDNEMPEKEVAPADACQALALIAIAAELRAQRIARRPGAGNKPAAPPDDPSWKSA